MNVKHWCIFISTINSKCLTSSNASLSPLLKTIIWHICFEMFNHSLSLIFIVTFRRHVVMKMNAIRVVLHLGQVKLQLPQFQFQLLDQFKLQLSRLLFQSLEQVKLQIPCPLFQSLLTVRTTLGIYNFLFSRYTYL